jgi:hypothetical protein
MAVHEFGAHLKVFSDCTTPPTQRAAGQGAPALLLMCHGLFVVSQGVQLTRPIPVPVGYQVRFAVPHGETATVGEEANFLREAVEEGLQPMIQRYYPGRALGPTIPNYRLGKREAAPGNPHLINGANPNPGKVGSHWVSKKYMKSVWNRYQTSAESAVRDMESKANVKLGQAFDWLAADQEQESINTAIEAENLFAAAAAAAARATSKECDIARIRKTCRTLSDVFQDLTHPHQYQFLLCNFCREGVDG